MSQTTPLSDAEIQAVTAAMRDVSRTVILPMFDNPAPIESSDKSGKGDWVTEGDIQAERALTAFLNKLRPDSTVLGEEVVGTDVALYHTLRNKPGMVWTVDPIDGTLNFRAKNPRFGTMIACVYDNVIQQAWIYCPRLEGGIMLTAGRGRGAFAQYDNGRPTTRLQAPTHTRATMLSGYHLGHNQVVDERWFPVVETCARANGLGVFAHTSMAADAVEMVLHHRKALVYTLPKLWDSAPPALILNESGGVAAPINQFAQDIYGHNGEDFYVFAPNLATALALRGLFGQRQAA
ncbi:MAG: hypothetical protein JO126_04305 [Alphaproteobacteria bacterium]|nr:hypothetical protein [Alphaproteobacteria bacterium]MBV8548659.1 hypothetical protein [Alphaproteobacteria bacterium]